MRSPGQARLDRLTRIGVVLWAVGGLAAAVIVGAYLVGLRPPGTWAYLVAMLMPVGLGLVLAGLLGAARARARSRRGPDGGRS